MIIRIVIITTLIIPSFNCFSKSLSLLSWNLQWLSKSSQNNIIRNESDYAELHSIFNALSPDIFAFQEVNSLSILYKIVPSSTYNIYISERINIAKDKFIGNNQFTGFAIKKSLSVTDYPDLTSLSTPEAALGLTSHFNRKLRYGTVININWNGLPVLLLNIHLKSGCFTASQLKKVSPSKSCLTLSHQLKLLRQWINHRIETNQAFIILGDFNHRLHIDEAENIITFKQRLTLYTDQLIWLNNQTNAKCTSKSNKVDSNSYRTYYQMIDHIFSSHHFYTNKSEQINYTKQQLNNFQLSDHCPLFLIVKKKKYI